MVLHEVTNSFDGVNMHTCYILITYAPMFCVMFSVSVIANEIIAGYTV